ncbi:MAG: hypothetical protein ACK5G7_04100, partial [Erysipelotrichaceae bacterium]
VDYVGSKKIFRLISKYYQGKHLDYPICHFYQAKKVKIVSDKKVYYSIDGEVLFEKEMDIKINHNKLNIIVSKKIKEKLNAN